MSANVAHSGSPCERGASGPLSNTVGPRSGEQADFGSIIPFLLVRVRWSRAIGWVCKPEVTGSIPVRSILENPICRTFLGSVSITGNSGASAVRADRRIAVEPSRMRSSQGGRLQWSGDVE
jgi:hypothetical protein